MKPFVVLLVMSSVCASFALANPPEQKIKCRSLDGSSTSISLSAAEMDGNPGPWLRILIDGRQGRIDNQQESNDASVNINLIPSQNIFGMESDLTSDDAKDVYVTLEAKLETVKLAPGSDDSKGSANFIALLDAELDQHTGDLTRVIRKAKAQVVSCQASWEK